MEVNGTSFPGGPTRSRGARNPKKHAIFERVFGGWTADYMVSFFLNPLQGVSVLSFNGILSIPEHRWCGSFCDLVEPSYELTEADRILGRCDSMASEWMPGMTSWGPYRLLDVSSTWIL